MNNADKLEEEHICAHACMHARMRHTGQFAFSDIAALDPHVVLNVRPPPCVRCNSAIFRPAVALQDCSKKKKTTKKNPLSVCRLVAVRSRGDQLISPVSSPVPLLLQHSLLHASTSHNGFTYNLTCHHLRTCMCLITPPCLSLQHLLASANTHFPSSRFLPSSFSFFVFQSGC